MEGTMTAKGFDYDLVVIGSGLAGQKAALCAARLRKSVAIVERKWPVDKLGARSGTISSKTLREAVLSALRQRTFYRSSEGIRYHVEMFDLTFRVDGVIKSQTEAIKSELQRNRVGTLEGEAAFVDAHTVQVQGQQGSSRVTADNFLIAVGARSATNPSIPLDGKRIHSSDQLLSLRELPGDLIIVGAGLIGLEYASLLAALGVRVTLVDQRSALLTFVDREVVESFCSGLRQLGVTFRLGEKVVDCAVDAAVNGKENCVIAELESGGSIRGESLLYTAGRQGNTDQLNLAAVGLVPIAAGKLDVNDQFCTAVPNIYAAGDVIGFPVEELYYGSISMEQGRLAACHIFGFPAKSRPQVYPYAVYAIPEISMVGRTEQDLAQARVPYESGIARYGSLAKGQILGDDQGFLKLLFDPAALTVLGVHIIGESAAEIIHIGQAALCFGATMEYFRDTVFNYPTLAEAYKVAALDGLKKVGREV
jgi:NAD(P) transhydrogenase